MKCKNKIQCTPVFNEISVKTNNDIPIRLHGEVKKSNLAETRTL